jgi:hypothetical protein
MKKLLFLLTMTAVMAVLPSCKKKGYCHEIANNINGPEASGSDYNDAKSKCEAAGSDFVWVDE